MVLCFVFTNGLKHLANQYTTIMIIPVIMLGCLDVSALNVGRNETANFIESFKVSFKSRPPMYIGGRFPFQSYKNSGFQGGESQRI